MNYAMSSGPKHYDGEGTKLDSIKGLDHEAFMDYYYKVKPKFINSLGRAAKAALTESEMARLKTDLQMLADTKFKINKNWLVTACIMCGVIAMTVFLTAGAVFGAVAAVFLALNILMATSIMRGFDKGKHADSKLEAVKSGKFAAYRLDIKAKMWHPYYSNKSHRLAFFIDCGSYCFEVEQDIYEMLGDKVVVVLYYLEDKTLLDFFVPDNNNYEEDEINEQSKTL